MKKRRESSSTLKVTDGLYLFVSHHGCKRWCAQAERVCECGALSLFILSWYKTNQKIKAAQSSFELQRKMSVPYPNSQNAFNGFSFEKPKAVLRYMTLVSLGQHFQQGCGLTSPFSAIATATSQCQGKHLLYNGIFGVQKNHLYQKHCELCAFFAFFAVKTVHFRSKKSHSPFLWGKKT